MEPSSLTDAQPCFRGCPLLKSSLLYPLDPDTGDVVFDCDGPTAVDADKTDGDELEYGREYVGCSPLGSPGGGGAGPGFKNACCAKAVDEYDMSGDDERC